jgi:hypothetical protein
LPPQALAPRWAKEDAPVTNDADQTPRIELRGPSDTQVVGIMIAGIPTVYGDKYLTANLAPFKEEISGQPTGRLCYDCVRKDKEEKSAPHVRARGPGGRSMGTSANG